MSYPICFSSRYSVGVTFLMWSYHWLSGHDSFWHSKLKFCKTPETPNTGINAHNFKKNFCTGYNQWRNFILDPNNKIENCSMYGLAPAALSLNDLNLEYAKSLKFASEHVPLIFCIESSDEPWYFLQKRYMTLGDGQQFFSNQEIVQFNNDELDVFLKTYFENSLQKVKSDVWDLRELIALNFNYFEVDHTYLDVIDRSIEHLIIPSKDIWYNGEECLVRIFNYLGQKIIANQLPIWRSAYLQWQSVQLKILKFNWYLPIVVDSIIHNYNFDLSFLNLTLLQEAVIQGHLIKNHHLNLRCHGLKQFPKNTKDLHSLLEESTHI